MKTIIVLLGVGDFERKQAENIVNREFVHINELREDLFCDKGKNWFEFELTDFMDACNNQEIDLENYWVTYVKVKLI